MKKKCVVSSRQRGLILKHVLKTALVDFLTKTYTKFIFTTNPKNALKILVKKTLNATQNYMYTLKLQYCPV